jgi:hypothetical protein
MARALTGGEHRTTLDQAGRHAHSYRLHNVSKIPDDSGGVTRTWEYSATISKQLRRNGLRPQLARRLLVNNTNQLGFKSRPRNHFFRIDHHESNGRGAVFPTNLNNRLTNR